MRPHCDAANVYRIIQSANVSIEKKKKTHTRPGLVFDDPRVSTCFATVGETMVPRGDRASHCFSPTDSIFSPEREIVADPGATRSLVAWVKTAMTNDTVATTAAGANHSGRAIVHEK